MPVITGIREFLKYAEYLPVIDVRSPFEYTRGHIPGAVSIPLFDNGEREKIGTIYHHEGSEKAFNKGFEIAEAKLGELIRQIQEKTTSDTILVHCWRGGMRSNSMAEFYESRGWKCYVLEGGYKSYRKYISEEFKRQARILLIGGMTGTGKTEILRSLKLAGEQVIDLEALACHKGSVFGHIGESVQPCTEQFANELFAVWNTFDLQKNIWIEDESISIGKIFLPESFWKNMCTGHLYLLKIPVEERLKNILDMYTPVDEAETIGAIRRIQRRLGSENTAEAICAIRSGNYREAVLILLKYYDKLYQNSLARRSENIIEEIAPGTSDPQTITEILVKKARNLVIPGF